MVLGTHQPRFTPGSCPRRASARTESAEGTVSLGLEDLDARAGCGEGVHSPWEPASTPEPRLQQVHSDKHPARPCPGDGCALAGPVLPESVRLQMLCSCYSWGTFQPHRRDSGGLKTHEEHTTPLGHPISSETPISTGTPHLPWGTPSILGQPISPGEPPPSWGTPSPLVWVEVEGREEGAKC